MRWLESITDSMDMNLSRWTREPGVLQSMGLQRVRYDLVTEKYFICMRHIFFILSSVDGCLGCSHILAIVNSAAMNVGVCIFFPVIVLSGYMPRSEIPGLHGIKPLFLVS